MKLSKIFFLTMSFFLLLSALLAFTHKSHQLMAGEGGATQEQIQLIDQEITELKEMKRGYESRAIRHENLGQMMQFESEYTLETRRHFQLAEQNREMAQKLQDDIDQLEQKKQDLLKRKRRLSIY